MAVGIAVANLTVRSMDVEFYSVSLRGRTRVFDRLALRIGNSGNAFRIFPTPGPLIPMRNYMNWFCHFFVCPYVSSLVFDTRSAHWHSAITNHHKSL